MLNSRLSATAEFAVGASKPSCSRSAIVALDQTWLPSWHYGVVRISVLISVAHSQDSIFSAQCRLAWLSRLHAAEHVRPTSTFGRVMFETQLSELTQTVKGMRKLVLAQARLIDGCLTHLKRLQDGDIPLPSGAEPEVIGVVTLLLHGTGVSARSVLKLSSANDFSVRDGYSITRSIVETSANISFILAEGRSAADLAIRHAEQKAFRDLRRESEAGGWRFEMKWLGEVSSDQLTRLSGLAAEFTTRSGRERTAWTEKNLAQRLADIGHRFGQNPVVSLHSAVLLNYRHASEILHGSYFGALFVWGVTKPGKEPSTPDDLRKVLAEHQFAVLATILYAHSAILDCFAQYLDLPSLYQESEQLMDLFGELPMMKRSATELQERDAEARQR